MQPHIWGRKTGPRPLRLAGPRSPNFLRKGAQFFFQKRAKVVPKLGSFLVPDFGTTKAYVERLTPKSGTKHGPSFGTQNWPQVWPKSRPKVGQLCARGGAIFGTLPSPASPPWSWGLWHASGRRCSHVARAQAAGGSACARGQERQAERGNARKLLQTNLDGPRRI